MWPFKNRYQKLKREEVVDAIYSLEKQEQAIEDGVAEKQEEIDFLLAKGKKERSEDLKLLYAKKINHLKQEIAASISKGSYLLYNIKMMQRLKEAIDDNEFFVSTSKISLGALLKDQNGLAKFLNKALNTKIAAEDVLTSADEIYNDIKNAYEPNKDIYGVTKSDDELLAVFETAEDDDVEPMFDAPLKNTQQEDEAPVTPQANKLN
jgi:anti-sigma28 factor (negative regulator of flagellin synthesis)